MKATLEDFKNEAWGVHPIQFDTVADLYDFYVNVDLDIDFFVREARQIGGKALELTSGTGRVSIPLLQAGVELTCLDYSGEMLAKLREKLQSNRLHCTVLEQNMTELTLAHRFDLIFIPFHSFQEIVDRSKHQQTLQRILAHLNPGGCFICTLQNPSVRLQSIDGTLRLLGRFPTGSDGSLEVKSILTYDAAERLVTGLQLYERFDLNGILLEKRQLEISFCLFSRNEFELLVRSAGFTVDDLFGDYACSPFDEETSPFMIWRLSKPRIDLSRPSA